VGLISWLLATIIDKRIAQFQNGLMTTHITEVEHIYGQMRAWRHDYHNHMQALKAHLHLHQYAEIDAYLDKLTMDLTQVDVIIKSGNVMADAILNSKISIARTREIKVNAKAIVPEKLAISEIDLCVIIGNLLDNAVEANAQIADPAARWLRVYIDVLKGQLYISVSNARAGEVRHGAGHFGKTFLTTKKEAGHGFGLVRIDGIVERYGGFVNRQAEEGAFATEVMLPL